MPARVFQYAQSPCVLLSGWLTIEIEGRHTLEQGLVELQMHSIKVNAQLCSHLATTLAEASQNPVILAICTNTH